MAPLEPGTILAEKFRVVRTLGSGGMGAVYEIVHLLTRHRRALKLLHGQWLERPEAVERFLREASAAGRIGNPHIVETFDAGRLPSGEPYLVMELLEGKTLAQRLAGAFMLDLEEIIDVIAQACDGVQAAHDAGIIHRDLKPENLFLTERDGRPFVKILDFGVSKFDARHTVDRMTQGGGVIGTPIYMSPEQVRSEDIDGRSDVFALGVIAYECATGVNPFAADSVHGVIVRVLETSPRNVTEARNELPAAFADAIGRAIEKDSSKRFPSAKAFGAALTALRSASPASLAQTLLRPVVSAAADAEVARPTARDDALEPAYSAGPPTARAAATATRDVAKAQSFVPPPHTETQPRPQYRGATLVSAQERPSRARLVVAAAVLTAAAAAIAWFVGARAHAGGSLTPTASERDVVASASSAGHTEVAPAADGGSVSERDPTPSPSGPPPAAPNRPPANGAGAGAKASGTPRRGDIAGKDEFRP